MKCFGLCFQNFLLNYLLRWALLLTRASKRILLFLRSLNSFSEMGSLIQKRSGLLTYSGTSSLLLVPSRESWSVCLVMKEQFWEMDDKLPLIDSIRFEIDKKGHRQYLSLFNGHPEGEGIHISLHSVLRMMIKKGSWCGFTWNSSEKLRPTSYSAPGTWRWWGFREWIIECTRMGSRKLYPTRGCSH